MLLFVVISVLLNGAFCGVSSLVLFFDRDFDHRNLLSLFTVPQNNFQFDPDVVLKLRF